MLPSRIAKIMLLGLGAGACNRPDTTVSGHFRAWQATRPGAYEFEYQRSCFCPASGAWWRVSVTADSVTGVVPVDSARVRQLAGVALMEPPTITTLFTDLIWVARQRGNRLRVTYDAQWHYPASIDADPRRSSVDDEWQVSVRNFRALP